ncbi:MAG: SDR family NAD(P)-dependent oxidoreductase [bacterium]|nr:SDR family NAD(P)-dependent oxidoreductase [bacterium]
MELSQFVPNSDQPFDYTNRVVFITGAAQGLGLAMAWRFAQAGATLVLCDVNEPLLKASSEAIEQVSKRRVLHSRVNVAASAEVDAWVAGAVDMHGRCDVLVNSAGIIRDGRIENTSDAQWHDVLDVNLSGTFYTTRAVVPHMKKHQYGRILSLTSMSWRGNFGQVNYSASKAGVVGLTRTIALEVARHAVTCNAIAPGLIDTPMLGSMNDAARGRLIAGIPAKRVGRPDEIASAALFLCSSEAGYINGVILDVDGGIGIGASVR